MKTAGAQLITLLNGSSQFLMGDLLTITLAVGTVLRFTNADFDIKSGGNTFSHSGLLFKRSKTQIQVGLEVDTMDLVLWSDGTYLVGGIPFMQFVANGGLDGAYVKLERAFMPSWGDTSVGTVWLFSGQVSDVSCDRFEARLKVKSPLQLLDINFPRNLYQPGCCNTLFDSGCGVVKATYTTAATANASSTKTAILVTNAQVTGYFDLGTVLFTSGNNTGVKRTIKSFVAGTPATINVSLPLPYVPAPGDAFSLVPGCDKTWAGTNGCPKFSNTARFRGFPFIPRPETAR